MFMWNSRKQTCSELSTSEAEYLAMCEVFSDIKWLRTLMAESNFELNHPSKMFCDNTVSNTWAKTSDITKRSKHIDLKYRFVKESVNDEQVNPIDIDSAADLADGFTMQLIKAQLEIFR